MFLSQGAPWGRRPAGGWFPTGGGGPPGGGSRRRAEALRGERPFLFLRKKKRFLTPKKKLGRSTGRFRVKTAACVFTHCLGTSPGRYGHAIVKQGKDGGSIQPPPGGATLAAECGMAHRVHHTWHSPAPPQGMHLTTPALREAPAGGGGLGPPACLCSQTAGRNGRKGSSMSYESR